LREDKKEEIMLSLYPYVLLLHIVGVLALFMTTGLELTILFRMRSAKNVGQVQEWTNASRPLEWLVLLAVLLILAAGLSAA
jgi:putative copper export protein